MIHLRNGDALAITLDRENEDYLLDCLGGASGARRVAWIETVDGCFIGLNLAHLSTILWEDADAAAASPTGWDREHLVLHAVDREPIRLPRVSGDEIDRLRGATICRHASPFFTLGAGQESPASFSLHSMTYVTLPSAWLDDDT